MQTPYYLIDKSKLLNNLKKIDYIRQHSGAKILLALKCFSTWCTFDFMKDYMDGTTSSSLYETQLGKTKFPGETHAYSVAFSDEEIKKVLPYADKIIFNSITQLKQFLQDSDGKPRGLRINPKISSSHFSLADPACAYSRLGEEDPNKITAVLPLISGFMLHYNCENQDYPTFDTMLSQIEQRLGNLFKQIKWISLGGGIHFTGDNYPIDKFCQRLKDFSNNYGVQVYLEPGEAAITNSTSLEVTVLDTFNNGKNIAVVDSSIEAHMLDLLTYRLSAKIDNCNGNHQYIVCGRSCLAGDIFGEFNFAEPLKIGDRLSFADAAGYTMVKKNWFNGLKMPSIAVKELDGTVNLIKEFGYNDFINNLS